MQPFDKLGSFLQLGGHVVAVMHTHCTCDE